MQGVNPYRATVEGYARLLREGRSLPLGGIASPAGVPERPDAPKVLILAPHPDDECIIGGLALRQLRERGAAVVNVAVTQGSNRDRQAGRLDELRAACGYLGFGLRTTVPGGLEKISPKGRAADPANWSAAVACVAAILREERPAAVFFPHVADWNGTHIGTHLLATEAMASLGPSFATTVVETEFWAAMDTPNLMIESSAADVADLVAATSFHAGEVRRNPYHLTLPAWMQDNVRRGGEIVGGQGGAAPDFAFATLYRVRRWERGGFRPAPAGRAVAAAAPLDGIAGV
ncbi:MAG: PIG-L family deacetylase [Lentisphaerae bacterium]|nr:PIG-L family deacetylase [Lentisphaerota bacterium]